MAGSVNEATVVGIREKKAPDWSEIVRKRRQMLRLTGCDTGDDDKDDERRERHADRPEHEQRKAIAEHGDDEGIYRSDPICQLTEQYSTEC